MWNVIYISVDKIEDDFELKGESCQELEKLVGNIAKITGKENALIVFTSDSSLEEVKYKAALLINYFNAAFINSDNIVIGSLLTEDAITDLCVKNGSTNDITSSTEPLRQKQESIVNAIGREIISKVIHLTNGIPYFLFEFIKDIKNILMHNKIENPEKKYGDDSILGENYIYILSEEEGIKGFNDCCDTYFQHNNSLKLVKKDN